MVRLSAEARCYGLGSKAWYHGLRALRRKDVSLREIIGFRHNAVSVIAVGGNSIGELQTPTIEQILLFRAPVLTHGNGPQVGELVIKHPDWTLNQCVRQTQDDIGNALKTDLEAQLRARGRTDVTIQVIPTRVIVDANDPAFKKPTKPIGKWYTLAEVEALGTIERRADGLLYIKEKDWCIGTPSGAKDSTRIYRRVVASPKPLAIHPEDLAKIKAGAREGNIVIACGGGGVPYVQEADGTLRPVEAVIDKDLASALLSRALKARDLIISTGEKVVSHYYRIPSREEPVAQYGVDYFMLRSALRNLRGGTVVKSDFNFLGTKRREVWRVLKDAGFIGEGFLLGYNKILPHNPVNLDGFRACLRAYLSPTVTDKEIDIVYLMLERAKKGQFPAGTVGEKVEAVINALRGGVNTAMITHPNRIWIKFEGTIFTRGWDIGGRLHNLGIWLGNQAEKLFGSRWFLPKDEIQRWLVTKK